VGWLRLQVDLEETQVESAENLLETLGALSVTVTDAGDAPVLEPDPGAQPLWPVCTMEALFDAAVDIGAVQRSLAEAGLVGTRVERLDDTDWQNAWRQYSVEFCFGSRLWLLPRDAPGAVEPALRLDPGLAFGSGSHSTTRLCLEWLAGQNLADLKVLDYGCGSGILGLAALKLGCASVLAIDHDPQALLATRENAAYNALAEDRLTVGDAQLLGERRFDLVLANILANPLIELAPVLTEAVADGGVLVMSGMLEAQYEEVIRAYPSLDFETPLMEADEQQSRWVCLVGRKFRQETDN